jgi:hypothetical protein
LHGVPAGRLPNRAELLLRLRGDYQWQQGLLLAAPLKLRQQPLYRERPEWQVLLE